MPASVISSSSANSTNSFTSGLSSISAPLSTTPGAANIVYLQKPFIVGPGYTPIPFKIVSKISEGKFVRLEDLLSENITVDGPEPELLFDGRLVLTNTAKKAKRPINDIITWMEAFSIYMYILGSYFPHRWTDLTKYKLLIVRTFRQFGGQGWLHYDREFSEYAAAERLTDWSNMNVQLYNFNTAGAPARPRLGQPFTSEAAGNSASAVVCISWNAGRCVAPTPNCRFPMHVAPAEGITAYLHVTPLAFALLNNLRLSNLKTASTESAIRTLV